jgi:hypothetical protein
LFPPQSKQQSWRKALIGYSLEIFLSSSRKRTTFYQQTLRRFLTAKNAKEKIGANYGPPKLFF